MLTRNILLLSAFIVQHSSPPLTKNKLENFFNFIPHQAIIAGDFNALHTAWGCDQCNSRGNDLLGCIQDSNFVLLNDGQYTTVGSHVWRRNARDLIIVSPSLALQSEWSVHDDPLGSFH